MHHTQRCHSVDATLQILQTWVDCMAGETPCCARRSYISLMTNTCRDRHVARPGEIQSSRTNVWKIHSGRSVAVHLTDLS